MQSANLVEVAELLNATQAAARLGVKRQTLYAYVSRGLLTRTVDLDGRTSLFDPGEIDALRSRSRRNAEGEMSSIISSAITSLDGSGHRYRGHQVLDLLAADVDFEQVADLLWAVDGRDDGDRWELPEDWAAAVHDLQVALPGSTQLLDRLRMTVALVSSLDPLRHDLSPTSLARAARRILLAYVVGLQKQHLGPRDRLADQLWLSLAPEAGTDAQRRCLNAVLVLLADHGLAASTFAVRVAASVRADPYSLVSTGLGAMGGVLHGAASAGVHELFERAERHGTERTLGQMLATDRRVPGVGHAVYSETDPREVALTDLLRVGWADDPRLEIVDDVRAVVIERIDEPPNIDFALGALTWLADMGPESGELFAVARTAGWIAHAIEEMSEKPVRFRPVARYVGPIQPGGGL